MCVAAALAGCSAEGYTQVARPEAGSLARPNQVWVASPNWDETAFALPRNAFASEAALYSLDDSDACFDVIVRGWSGAEGNWRVALSVDGQEVQTTGWMPFACTPDDFCLPRDTTLRSLTTDTDHLVSARGSRLCFRHVVGRTEPVHTLTLSATRGGTSLDFNWQLVPAKRSHAIGFD